MTDRIKEYAQFVVFTSTCPECNELLVSCCETGGDGVRWQCIGAYHHHVAMNTCTVLSDGAMMVITDALEKTCVSHMCLTNLEGIR